MTIDTTLEEATDLEQEVRTVALQLRDLKAEITGLQDRARAGDTGCIKDAATTVRQVRDWLRIVAETEAKLAERRQREEGGRGLYVLDLDGARASIRCRLDRLRACRGAGGVS